MQENQHNWDHIVQQVVNIALISISVFLIFSMCAYNGCFHVNDGKPMEAEIKQNLHAIQLALERYAVDNNGMYPIFVSGGDWTDSYIVTEDWLLINQLEISKIEDDIRRTGWQPAPPGMGDTLVMESYMPTYPGNPFLWKNRHRVDGELQTIIHHPNPDYCIPFERQVGGIHNDKMYEVFGPAMLHKNQAIAGDYYVHHIYNDPPYDVWSDIYKTPANGWDRASGNQMLEGNFSYYPHTEQDQSWPLIGLSIGDDSEKLQAIGYTLAGYGRLKTKGQDVYNRNGEYELHCRTETRASSLGANPLFPDAIPFMAEGSAPNAEANNGGRDGIPDGVIITLNSGIDLKPCKSYYGPDCEGSN